MSKCSENAVSHFTNFMLNRKQTLALKIKRIKPIPFQKETQSSAFLKSRGCIRGTACLRMASQIDLHVLRGKQSALFLFVLE